MAVATIYPLTAGWMDGDNPTSVDAPGTGGFLPTGQFGGTQLNRALIDFDLTELLPDYTVSSVNFQLTVSANFLGTSHTLEIYRVRRLWRRGNVQSASWNNYRQDHAHAAPTAPTLSTASSGGTWTAQTAWVQVTYVNQYGESLPSTITSIAVPAGGTLTIPSPASPNDNAILGWYAYIGVGASQPANTAMYRQQTAGSPTAIGTNLVMTANPTTTGANPGTTDTLNANWTSPGASDTTYDRDSTLIGSYAVTSATTGTITIPLDTTMLQDAVSGAWTWYGILLQASDEVDTTLMRWDYPSTPGATSPQLIIDYTPSTHTISEGVIAAWNLDNTGSGYDDLTGNNHTLTPGNAPGVVTGVVNDAASFISADTQYLTNSDAALKVGPGDFSFCCWVNLDDLLNLYQVAAVGTDAASAGGGFGAFYHEQTIIDHFVFQLYNNQIYTDPVISDVVSYSLPTPTPTNKWIFLAVRHDATRKWFQSFLDYQDGNGLIGPNSATSHNDGGNYGPYPGFINTGTVATTPSTPFYLGVDGNGTFRPMNGAIDEPILWGRLLSVADFEYVRDQNLAGLSYPYIGGPPIASLSLLSVGR